MATPKGTILVTGANGGLGTAIIQSIVAKPELATNYGLYTVRNAAAARSLRQGLGNTKSHPHDIIQLGLSDLSSVREAAAIINAKVSAREIPRVCALVLNAGYREAKGQTRTEDGFDMDFASNYLGHWLLVLLLLQSMNRESGRVVIVGGWVHDPHDKANNLNRAFMEEKWKTILADASSQSVESVAKGTWSTTADDPRQDPRQVTGIRRYGASKLCSIMIIPELQRRLDSDPKLNKISVLGVDPGMMATKITTGDPNWLVKLIIFIVTQVAGRISPNGMIRLTQKSAGDVLSAAFGTEPSLSGQPKGLYFNGAKPKEMSAEARDAEKRLSVWKASVRYAALRGGETCLLDWE